jgi:hypothetical protein
MPSLLRRAIAAITVVAFALLGASLTAPASASPIPGFSLSGTVTNLTTYPAGTATVEVGYYNTGTNSYSYSSPVNVAADGTYSVTATNGPGSYDLRFTISGYAVPFLTTYYGGGADEPADGTIGTSGVIDGTSGSNITGINVALIPAGYITGVVMAGGSPVIGELVDAYDPILDTYYDAAQLTDPAGNYGIKVVAGTDYVVETGDDNGYEYQAFNGHNGCDCTYDAVTVGAGLTRTGIDFDLQLTANAISIGVFLLGDNGGGSSQPLPDGTINLYKSVTGGYSLVDSQLTDASGNADLGASNAGDYRIRVSHTDSTPTTTWYPIEAYEVFNPSNPTPAPVFLPPGTCYLPLPGLQPGDQLGVITEILNDTTQCGPEPAITVSTVPTVHHHHHSTVPASAGTVVTPTPTPTSTPTETPSASPSPTPSSSSTPAPVPTPSPSGLPWWVWLLIIIAVVVILGVLGFVLLRRR